MAIVKKSTDDLNLSCFQIFRVAVRWACELYGNALVPGFATRSAKLDKQRANFPIILTRTLEQTGLFCVEIYSALPAFLASLDQSLCGIFQGYHVVYSNRTSSSPPSVNRSNMSAQQQGSFSNSSSKKAVHVKVGSTSLMFDFVCV